MIFIQTQILNWDDIINQFGLDIAKKISKSLTTEIQKNGLNKVVTTPCHCNSEAVAIFQYDKFVKSKLSNKVFYRYTGTAN